MEVCRLTSDENENKLGRIGGQYNKHIKVKNLSLTHSICQKLYRYNNIYTFHICTIEIQNVICF